MDLLHSWGVELAVHLQTRYSQYEGLFRFASAVADLHTTYFWFFPIWFHLRRDSGLRLLWVAVLGDWLNMVLKWILFGQRPYWWVHDTSFYGTGSTPTLQQFPVTCETGPGSPSGHAMGAAGVWFVMVTATLSAATEKRCPPLLYKFLQLGLWSLMVVVLLVVCMSRVYVAAHFPHQVIAGVFMGLLVAVVVSSRRSIYTLSMASYFLVTLFLTSFGVGFNVLLEALGVPLDWTLALAQRWCVNPDWVHMDSTPLASLLRNMGSLLGLGLGLHSPLKAGMKKTKTSFRLGCVLISLLLLQILDAWTFSAEHLATFYFLSFGKNVFALLIPTSLVPWALSWIFTGERDKNQ